ncbi:CAP domain-containing protein [Alkaliphilus peptidifermentans]|uniref:Uncharacterized protein, YkwD family n=1 Tax=Alkaliphilus peptidifermentans DSM 18978 TaxID=1120976 RepID=A0A1G5FG11_9FIRM|nr:CAP domain-containing protein [Alkaliphilus peptidifermentans]SCY38054.1 uncharacterized protein, YkwD family [Alkaliphilus peptidifermentans DSM 18978]
MKNRIFILLASLFLLTSCAPPQERPPGDNQVDYKESSIFHTAPVKHGRITKNDVEVKSGLGRDFETIANLKLNDVVRVLDHVNDWYVIQLDNNQIGSIEVDSATPVVKERNGGNGEEIPFAQYQEGTEVVPEATPDDVQWGDGSAGAERQQVMPGPRIPEQAGDQNDTPNRQPQETTMEGAQGRNLSSEEQQLVDLVNSARQTNGLPPLQISFEVTRVARIKSQDMIDNNYFSHYSPIHGSPFEMLDSYGVDYLHAGENLAANASIENAHTALMDSSGHRKNILNPDFTHIGIGIRPSQQYGYMITQMFISKPQ